MRNFEIIPIRTVFKTTQGHSSIKQQGKIVIYVHNWTISEHFPRSLRYSPLCIGQQWWESVWVEGKAILLTPPQTPTTLLLFSSVV